MASSSPQKVWAITGTSIGLGRELVHAVLARGDKVIATARSCDSIKDLQESYPDNCRILQLDVTDTFETLAVKAKEAVAIWGVVDVLVNNAGSSLIGAVEESGADGLMEVFKVNVFGSMNVVNAFLPYMRVRRSGVVVFVGSRSGWRTTMPTSALYSSSKAALHFALAQAISDILGEELRPLNIRVLNVVPGSLRTDILTRTSFNKHVCLAQPGADVDPAEVPEYAALRTNIKAMIQLMKGKENGDAGKAATAIVDVVRREGLAEGKTWSNTLVLGSDAERDIRSKCEGMLKNMEEWKDVLKSVDV